MYEWRSGRTRCGFETTTALPAHEREPEHLYVDTVGRIAGMRRRGGELALPYLRQQGLWAFGGRMSFPVSIACSVLTRPSVDTKAQMTQLQSSSIQITPNNDREHGR